MHANYALCLFYQSTVTDKQRYTLVQLSRLNIQDRIMTIRCISASLFGQIRKRACFIEQSQFAFRPTLVRGIEKNASKQEISVKVCYQRANVSF